MFPSNNCNNEPVYYNYSDQSGFHRPFPNDITLNSKQDDPSFPFSHLEDHDIFLQQYCCDFLLHQLQPLEPDIDKTTTTTTSVGNMVDFDPTNAQVNATPKLQIPRKRPLKKDRHSKINTARGPRDRRMRLSLEVARPFFNLQDKLGYDKASKTVEWLLIRAESEIKKLERGLPEMNYSFSGVGEKSASSTSECEVVSEINEAAIRGSSNTKSRGKPSIKGKKTRQSRKFTLRPLTKDLREKARARARERTCYKKIMRSNRNNNIDDEGKNDNDLNKFCSLSVFENNGTEDHFFEADVPTAGKVQELQDLASHEYAVDDSSAIPGKWSPSSIFNYSHNMGIALEHQFADFQFFGKPYEA